MVKLICSFTESVLTGVAGFLLLFALIVGMSQYANADMQLSPDYFVPPVACTPAILCAACTTLNPSCPCAASLTDCAIVKCTSTGNDCPGCNCKAPVNFPCDCYL